MGRKLRQSLPHLDANEGVYFSRQLTYIKSKVYQTLYPAFKARDLIPISFEVDPGAESIQYEIMDAVGVAKIVASYANDLPRADVRGQEFLSPVKSLADSYGYSIQEIRAAAFRRVNLKQNKANAAKQGMAFTENKIALMGDTATGLPGLLTNPNIPRVVLPADGTGSSSHFETKTPRQIIRDLTNVANSIQTTTFGVEAADTLLLPLSTKAYLANTPYSDYSDRNVLDVFMDQNEHIVDIETLNELETLGTSAGKEFLFYKRDPDVLTLEIPQDFEQFDPQAEGLEFVVPCHQRIGGTIVVRPLAMAIGDGC